MEEKQLHIGRGLGLITIKDRCLKRAAENNFVIDVDASDFSTKANGVVFYTCKNKKKNGQICNSTHKKFVKAFLAFEKKHCPSCATGRGTTRATMTTDEQKTERKKRFVRKKLQGSNQGTNVSGKNLDSGTLREIVSDPAVVMRTDSKAEHKDAVNKSRWNSIIRALFNYKSFLTGEAEKQKVLNAHHLVARSIAPHRTNDPNNGVLITKEQHYAKSFALCI